MRRLPGYSLIVAGVATGVVSGCTQAPESGSAISQCTPAVEGQVRRVLAKQLRKPVEELASADTSLIYDLCADSVNMVKVVLALEEEFNIEIPDEDTEKLQTVGDFTSYICTRKSA